MYRIGIDVGSTYTKYCIMQDNQIIDLFMEKTPIKQLEYFSEKVDFLREKYGNAAIVSCGYGKRNVDSIKNVNELTALAKGAYYIIGSSGVILDIGGQDTKVIFQENGNLIHFFVNDKCAAGSGMFLSSVLNMLDKDFEMIDISNFKKCTGNLSSVCAVFAQSEIVNMIVDNMDPDAIINLVIKQILVKAKVVIDKVDTEKVYLTGGLSQIKGINAFASDVLGVECKEIREGSYISAIGCALLSR